MVTLKSIQMVCFEMKFGEQSLMFQLLLNENTGKQIETQTKES